jgi:GcrA cell cycle regulator
MSKTAKRSKAPKAPKALLDLGAHDCRWPIGEPRQPGFHFCGEPQAAGRPYCALHWQMAFQPARPRHQPSAPVPVAPATAKAA